MGRHLKYRSADELQAKINDYFESCREHIRKDANGADLLDKYGRPVIDGAKPLTVTGLQLALGFKSRQTLLNYKSRSEYREIIERAKLRIECYTEERLFDRDGYSGAAFSLFNNFGWGRDSSDSSSPAPMVKIIIPR